MKLAWNDIPTAVRNRLETELVNSDVRSFKSPFLQSLLNGCELLEYRWDIQKGSRDTILSAFTHTFSHVDDDSWKDFLSCIYHLSANDLKWNCLPSEVIQVILNGIERISDHMGAHQFSKLLHRSPRISSYLFEYLLLNWFLLRFKNVVFRTWSCNGLIFL
jgi:hypothetical protein